MGKPISEKEALAIEQLKTGKTGKRAMRYRDMSPEAQEIYQKVNAELMGKALEVVVQEVCKLENTKDPEEAVLLFYKRHQAVFDLLNSWKTSAGWTPVCRKLIGEPAADFKALKNAQENKAKILADIEKKQAKLKRYDTLQKKFGDIQ